MQRRGLKRVATLDGRAGGPPGRLACFAALLLALAGPAQATLPDAITMHHGTQAALPVLANDTGTLVAASVFIDTPPAAGSATPLSDGRIRYAHTNGLPAGDSFTYRVVDSSGVTSTPETVTITFSAQARLAATTLALPDQPPATSYEVVDAFPGLTFSAPTSLENAPGDTNHLFVVERAGRIHVITNIASASPEKVLFLDINTQVFSDNELGMKGMAFHPGYATNRLFYVTYCTTQSTVRLSRFERATNDYHYADPATELVLIEQTNNGTIHNIDEVTFGPDGYLYVGFGDEGQVGDTQTNSQTITRNFWSSILRIDPDKQPGNLEPNPHPAIRTNGAGLAYYSVPTNNPFVGATQFNGSAVNPAEVRTEFYAVGFRNPWQFSFDPLTDELWVGDVGHQSWEKVCVLPAGGNAGWAFFEGTYPGPRTPPPGFTYNQPVWEYPHGDGLYEGSAICGGLVVRGPRYPDLDGKYLCADIIKGHIWTIQRAGFTTLVERIAGDSSIIVQFGLDPSNGDVLMVGYDAGKILRLLVNTNVVAFPPTLADTGLFADLADLTPNPGVVPYELNLPFWSDYALKRRWFALTNLTDAIGYAREEPWASPPGMAWVKHFDLELDRGNPATRQRVETRVIVRTTNGMYGVSYRWNEAGTEAELVPDGGVGFALAITNAGQPGVQHWQIPSRAQCRFCHEQGAAFALGFSTRQLNRTGTLAGVSGNFIDRLAAAGYFSNAVDAATLRGRHLRPDESAYSLEARARSWLAVNCAYCHRGAASSVPGNWDGRIEIRLADCNVVRVPAAEDGGDTNNLLLVPGDAAHSILWNRLAATNGFSRMPPLGTSELDPAGVQLVANWIAQELAGWQDYAAWQLAQFGSTNAPDSAPGDDPDGDLRSNYEEFLAYSSPTNPASYWTGDIRLADGQAEVSHALFNRGVRVETSTNLAEWMTWLVEGNDGLPRATGTVVRLTGPSTNGPAFFRFQLEER
jgi:uncharacterized repeat protein (TIGR03806 family)